QTLFCMNGLGSVYWAAGQKEKALRLYEETLELRKRHLGPAHRHTLVSMNNLAEAYLEKMQIDKALHLFEESLEGMKKKLAALHPERLNTTRSLARAYHVAEKIDKAAELQEGVVRDFKKAYGLEDRATQNCIDNLIAYKVDMGWCDKAEALLASVR